MSKLEQWQSAWLALGVEPSPELQLLRAELLKRYSEPHRHYHTVRHLEECFEHLQELKHYLPHPAEVEIALWFHDAIYDTHRTDNEALSAQWAVDSAQSFGVNQSSVEMLRGLVMFTQHAAAPLGLDAEALVDVDLSILGAKPERFAEYEHQIRQEYAWVPEPQVRSKRTAVLMQFLARPHIFSSTLFRARYEHRARANIERSLAALGREQ
jgi:predicted metal-dependent HD superfamily phosphohydrolase